MGERRDIPWVKWNEIQYVLIISDLSSNQRVKGNWMKAEYSSTCE